MRLTITRHGQTEENLKGVVQGQNPGNLTRKGIEQAKNLALKLKDENFDLIYSSDLKRCKDTTKEIIKYHSTTPVIYSKDIREISFGSLQGRAASGIDWSIYNGGFLDMRPGGGESRRELYDRVNKFLIGIRDDHQDDSILLVTHGGAMRVIKSVLENMPFSENIFKVEIENCELWTYDI